MIVVEGPDGCGKTTLVNQISVDCRLRVGARNTADRDNIWKTSKQDTYEALAEAVEGNEAPVVWDRLGPFSDPVYSRVLGHPPQFKSEEIQFTSAIFKALRCPIIICIVPLEVAQGNAETTHQMKGVHENFAHIHGKYGGLFLAMRSWPNTHAYNYRIKGAYDELLENVIRPYLRRRKDREWG